MARTQFTFTFTNAQPGADVGFNFPAFADSSTTVADGTLVLDSTNSVSVWADAAYLIAHTVDGRGVQILGVATSAYPTQTIDAGVPGPNPFPSGGSSSLPIVQLTSTSGWVIGTSQPSAWADAGSAGGTALTPDAAAGTIAVNENGFYLVLARLSTVVCTAAGYLTLDDTNGRFLVDRSLPISTYGATLSISDLVFQTAGTVMALEVYTGDGALAGHGGNVDLYVTQIAKSAI